MPNDGLKYVHVCSEGKTLGKILQSLIDMRGDISDSNKKIEHLDKNVDELNKQINNGISGVITKLKKRVEDIETGERPKLNADKIMSRLSKVQKLTIGIAAIPILFSYGGWVLRGIQAGVEFLIEVWPK